MERNFLSEGYWAEKNPEIPIEGLSVRFLIKTEDVTDSLRSEDGRILPEKERKGKIKILEKRCTDKMSGYEGKIVSMFSGNRYYLYQYQVFDDIRLVGVPPLSLGKFGKDVDNWMWPRHTGDFSMFRVYADANNNPAEYSESNVPYRPENYLRISLDGVKENDFTMIMGFPGRTNRYITASELVERRDIDNAIRAEVRGIRQDILMEDMLADPKVYIQYADKYANSSNYWKNSIGMNESFIKQDVENRRLETEAEFTAWMNEDPERVAKYGTAIDAINKIISDRASERRDGMYATETFPAIELLAFAGNVADRIASGEDAAWVKNYAEAFYKNFSLPTDMKVAKAMLSLFKEKVASAEDGELYKYIADNYAGDIDRFVDDVYASTVFSSEESLANALEGKDKDAMISLMDSDKAAVAGKLLNAERNAYALKMNKGAKELADAKKAYVGGLLEMKDGAPIYPDANLTLRLTYGKVLPYSPMDAVMYCYYTTLKGVMEKEQPGNHEFEVPQRLKDLYNAGDFGRYAMEDGRMPVAFITNNDITGGNSGSPIMNAEGELIGLAFDGNWEAISGDVIFEPQLQRCINVDIRYVLFIIDKFGGAGHLVDEMTIAE